MKHFTIENETNNITAHTSAKEADAVPDSERFSNEAALAKLAANWPAARLVEIFNSLPGVTEVRKFKDRTTAVSRIWKAIQTLGQAGANPVAAPEAAQTEATDPGSPAPDTATPLAPQTPDVAPEIGRNRRADPSFRISSTLPAGASISPHAGCPERNASVFAFSFAFSPNSLACSE